MRIQGLTLLLAVLAWTSATQAQDCCDRCGCQSCRKVCRVVCETKKVPHTTYSCDCEDYCLPNRSQRDGCTCETDCCGCEKCKRNYIPTCATVKTKHKLVKHVEQKEVKSYKWVVETLCDHCCHECGADSGAAPTTTTAGDADDQLSPPTPPAGASAERRTDRNNVKPVSFIESIFGSK